MPIFHLLPFEHLGIGFITVMKVPYRLVVAPSRVDFRAALLSFSFVNFLHTFSNLATAICRLVQLTSIYDTCLSSRQIIVVMTKRIVIKEDSFVLNILRASILIENDQQSLAIC